MDIGESDLCRGFTPEEVNEITSLGVSRVHPPDTVLFRLGEEAGDLFLVTRGRVDLTLPMRLGKERGDVLIEERLPGQVLGWSGLIPPHRFTLQAAIHVETELMGLPRQHLLELFSRDPELGRKVYSNLAEFIGARLLLFQTMWVREMQRSVESRGV